jgi:hypothetical protein
MDASLFVQVSRLIFFHRSLPEESGSWELLNISLFSLGHFSDGNVPLTAQMT